MPSSTPPVSLQQALARHQAGDHETALRWAEAVAPESPDYVEALSLRIAICRRLGRRGDLVACLRRLIAVEPGNLEARLALADLLHGGAEEEAFALFNEVVADLLRQRDRALLERYFARLRVAPHAAVAVLRRRLTRRVEGEPDGPARRRFLRFVSELFDSAAAAAQLRDPLQRPSFFFYPEIEQSPWYPPERVRLPRGFDFARLRREALALLRQHATRPYLQADKPMAGALERVRNDADWSVLVLRSPEGWRVDLRSWPVLREYLHALPLAECPLHAPEVILSVLAPGMHIPPHHGLSNFKLAHHLPIEVPEGDLGITVGGQTRRWREGEALCFDDSFLHEAWNRGDRRRVVLIADVWHPDLEIGERNWLREAVAEIDRWLAEPANRVLRYGLFYRCREARK